YSFDRSVERDQVYSIDTPPPTVSGSLHVGHVFSYTHRRYRPLSAHAGQVSFLPHGLGRQRASDRASSSKLFRDSVRPITGLRPRLHSPTPRRKEDKAGRSSSGFTS